jgi:hypothetical protein
MYVTTKHRHCALEWFNTECKVGNSDTTSSVLLCLCATGVGDTFARFSKVGN